MDSKSLNVDQLDSVAERLREIVAYLHALKDRMEQRSFPTDDEIYRATVEPLTGCMRRE